MLTIRVDSSECSSFLNLPASASCHPELLCNFSIMFSAGLQNTSMHYLFSPYFVKYIFFQLMILLEGVILIKGNSEILIRVIAFILFCSSIDDSLQPFRSCSMLVIGDSC
jgi:hypothetical protein